MINRAINFWTSAFARIDAILRGRQIRADRLTTLWPLWLILIASGCCYGAIMGTFAGMRIQQMAYSAIKVPLLLLTSFSLTLPSFFVLTTILGLRADFPESLAALASAQATLTIVLASLAPVTLLWYASVPDYQDAILFNAAIFAIASAASQFALHRSYRTLIRRNQKHRWMLRAWLLIYIFVAIQAAWVLRPFVGQPALSTTFFRQDAFTNSYNVIAQMLLKKLPWRFP
jgi:heme/copper-type cytochrome/quinol oxidase subunit 3